MPAHIKAEKDQIAERVIIAGDPERVEQLSKLIESPVLINTNRGFITYTGTYNGVRVSISCHGIGAPSAAIVFEELVSLGARIIVRFGTAGGLRREIRRGDIILPTFAGYVSGPLSQYCGTFPPCTVPDLELTLILLNELKGHNIKLHIGPVFSSDAFYVESKDLAETLSQLGYLGIEMECATIFGLGMLRNVKTASLLIVSNNLIDAPELADAKELYPYVQTVGTVVMNSFTKI